MRRPTLAFGLAILVAGWSGIALASPTSSDYQRSFRHYELLPIGRTDLSTTQRALLAYSLASAETGTSPRTALSAALSPTNQDTVAELLHSDTNFSWSTSVWQGVDRTTYNYNGSQQKTRQLTESFDGSVWNNSTQTLYTYNAGGTVETSTVQDWVSSAWANQNLTIYAYDGNNNVIQAIIQIWSGGAWVNGSKVTLTYASGQISTFLVQSWSSGAWVNSHLETYTYDVGGHLTVHLFQTWQASAWVNQSQDTYTYNGSGDRTSETSQLWQSSAWTNVSNDDYAYNGSHQPILDTSSTWLVTMWMAMSVDSGKYTGTLLTERVHASLLGSGTSRTDYTYDAHNNETEEITQDYDMIGHTWTNSSRIVSVYSGSVGSCCTGVRGNINGTGIIDSADLAALVNYLTNGGFVPPCMDAANVNAVGIVDSADLSALVNYLTNGGFTLKACP
jgi:hypothetical protein